MKHPIIAPSLLAADFSKLGEEMDMVEQSLAPWIHLDIMDGNFVPNISYGIPVLESLKDKTNLFFDVHLMIENPDQYIQPFKKAGADMYTVHYEACTHLHRTIQSIKEAGMLAGVALNPHTPTQVLKDIIADLDLVLIMSVNPGFGGQSFIPQSLKKIAEVRQMIDEQQLNCLIEIDGGVGMQNAKEIKQAGCDVLVAGSSVFGAEDAIQAIADLHHA